MSRTNMILRQLLEEIAVEQQCDLEGAAKWLVGHEWDEVTGVRREFYEELGGLLRTEPLDLRAIQKSIQTKGDTILGGFSGYRARLNDFFKQDEAGQLIRDLIGDGSRIPDADVIDSFVKSAVRLAFHGPGGKPRDASGAAKFASVLLTAVFPNHFVDFVHEHWRWMATNFELGMIPVQKTTNYGERLLWAGRVAKQFARTPTFRRYFPTERANWTVAGLVYLFSNNKELKSLVEKICARLPMQVKGDFGMAITPEEIWDVLQNHNPQVILQGPPGSGKTYLAERVIEHLAGSQDLESCRLTALRDGHAQSDSPVFWEIIQFHPSYSYEDFVRGLVTLPTEKGIVFQAQDRILAEAAKVAIDHPQTPVILVLDEINRADLSRVLGELIYALERDRRGAPVSSQYAAGNPPDRTLRLPRNLYLIGTMNTADRSIALVDYAIRRRFSFFSILPRIEAVETFYKAGGLHDGDEASATQIGPKVVELYRAIYELFDGLGDSADDIRIGHSYFLVKGSRNGEHLSLADWADAIAFRFAFEVLPMLAEYRKEQRIPDGQNEIEVAGQRFSLKLSAQSLTRSNVKQWLMQE